MSAIESLDAAEVGEIKAIDNWPTNGHLIADCARLGYLRAEWRTLDPTYGYGTFWKVWRPDDLIACDGAPHKSPIGYAMDFTDLPFADREFHAVVFDPPYKLNGTPDTEGVDERFGVHEVKTWQERIDLMRRGLRECLRVASEHVLVKCQDQVSSGKMRWQTAEMIRVAEECGFGLVDRFDFLGGRPQPDGRRQVHARHNSSQLLIFRRGWRTSDIPTAAERIAELEAKVSQYERALGRLDEPPVGQHFAASRTELEREEKPLASSG